MFYKVSLYMDVDNVHFVKVDNNGLDELRTELGNPVAPTFIEVYCYDSDEIFGVNREKVNAYTYKEVKE